MQSSCKTHVCKSCTDSARCIDWSRLLFSLKHLSGRVYESAFVAAIRVLVWLAVIEWGVGYSLRSRPMALSFRFVFLSTPNDLEFWGSPSSSLRYLGASAVARSPWKLSLSLPPSALDNLGVLIIAPPILAPH
ncbi:hypothetical protein MRX96_044986 [Rhipicephalus microplus]